MSRANAPTSTLSHEAPADVGSVRLQHYGNRILALMLLLLHAAFVWGQDELWGQAVVLAHYGVFLLWQPFFSGQQRLAWHRTLGVLLVGVALAGLHNVWVATLWCVMLAGLLGAVAVTLPSMRERLGLWAAVLYLLLLLFVWLLPQGYGLPVRHISQIAFWRDSLLLLPLAAVLFPTPRISRGGSAVDLLYALMFVLIIGVLALGSYVAMHLRQSDYASSLLLSMSTLAATLLIFAWLWEPRGGSSGLRNMFSRYVLSLGLPLEEWLKQLSDAAEQQPEPDVFLRGAMTGFTHLPWSTGVTWRTPASSGSLGEKSKHAASFTHLEVEVTFYTESSVNPAFALHLRLLTEIIGYFYAAKTRERAMRANAYSQAIFETGSRLTHDVKNLLQSLKTLCSAAEHSRPEQAMSLQTLMQRQLPQMAKRLEITLDKLKAPERALDTNQIQAREWWRVLKARYAREDVRFTVDDVNSTVWLPQELFDSVADNLVQNALRKCVGHPDVSVSIDLETRPYPCLTVCDSGEAVPAEVQDKLFHAPVSTYDGLGIGLYQATKQAASQGYRLELAVNHEGEVCFSLMKTAE
ncbi:MAG: sensor histidine kinase [Gallionellaceae bacterium]|nr:sensor histidine kinase [Gallionellaceae bacterium]